MHRLFICPALSIAAQPGPLNNNPMPNAMHLALYAPPFKMHRLLCATFFSLLRLDAKRCGWRVGRPSQPSTPQWVELDPRSDPTTTPPPTTFCETPVSQAWDESYSLIQTLGAGFKPVVTDLHGCIQPLDHLDKRNVVIKGGLDKMMHVTFVLQKGDDHGKVMLTLF